MKKYEMYIGTEDIESMDKERYAKLLDDITSRFKFRGRSFSIEELMGGYVFNDQTYIVEPSVKITCIDEYDPDEFVDAIVKFKEKYEQESIMILVSDIEREYK